MTTHTRLNRLAIAAALAAALAACGGLGGTPVTDSSAPPPPASSIPATAAHACADRGAAAD